jgi:hypothetical protein
MTDIIASRALVHASCIGDYVAVQELLAQPGVDPMYQEGWGGTALDCAARKDHVDVVHLLLQDARVDPNGVGVIPILNIMMEYYHAGSIDATLEIIAMLLAHPDIHLPTSEFIMDNLLDEHHQFVEDSFPILAILLLDQRVDPWMGNGEIIRAIIKYNEDPFAWTLFIRWIEHPATLARWDEYVGALSFTKKERKLFKKWYGLWRYQIDRKLYRQHRKKELQWPKDISREIFKYIRG